MRFTASILATLTLVISITVSAQTGQGPAPPPPQGQGRGQRPLGPPPQGPPPLGRGGPGGRGGFGGLIVPESNPLTPEKIALGKTLFFNTQLSKDNTTSCATCHKPDHAFADGLAVAKGLGGSMGVRNTPTLVNAGYGRGGFFWDGRADSLEQQVLGPITNPKEMGLSVTEIESRTGLPSADVANALASYVRTIRSRDSRYDWYQAGQTQMLTAEERAGLELFRGRAQCGVCHGGPNLTDDRFHNTGVAWRNGRMQDEGRFVVTGDERDHGAFKTPTLRDIALTAPYMHDGSQATLEDVFDYYSDGGHRNPFLDPRMRPARFTTDEKHALVAFLRALTGKITDGY